jgi:hypothetical protein
MIANVYHTYHIGYEAHPEPSAWRVFVRLPATPEEKPQHGRDRHITLKKTFPGEYNDFSQVEPAQRLAERALVQFSAQRKTPKTAASTFVRLTRDDLEDWLETTEWKGHKWIRKEGKVGVYQLPLSDSVAIELFTTLSKSDDVMGKGMASMKLRLMSRVTDQTLNRKAMEQGHFKRTLGWQKTWLVGINRMKDAYIKSADFYDLIATVKDRDAYKKDALARIEAVSEWASNIALKSYHAQVLGGGILNARQEETLAKAMEKPVVDEALLERTRNLYRAARRVGDQWTMDFAENLGKIIKAGGILSPNRLDILNEKFRIYKVPEGTASRVAHAWTGDSHGI